MNFLFNNLKHHINHILLVVLVFALSACAVDGVKVEKEEVSSKQKSIDIDPDLNDDFEVALELLKKAEYQKAVDVLEKVVEKESRLPAPFVNLGIAYVKLGDNKKAETMLHKALDIDLGHPIANNELGLLYRKAGKFDQARKAYKNALTVHPNYLPARKNLGILCDIYLHDYECALKHFEEYQRYKPEDKSINIWIADVKQRLGK